MLTVRCLWCRCGTQLICLSSVCALVTPAASGVSSFLQSTSALLRHQLMARSRCGRCLTSLAFEYVTAVAWLWIWLLLLLLLSMSIWIIDLYCTELWSISTALCALSGNDEIGSFSAIVWSCCCWAPGHRDCPGMSGNVCKFQTVGPATEKARRLKVLSR